MEDGARIASGGLGLDMGDAGAVAALAGNAEHRPVRVEAVLLVPGERGGVAADAVRALFGGVEIAQRVFVLFAPGSREPAVPGVREGEPEFTQSAAGREGNGREAPQSGTEDGIHRDLRRVRPRRREPDTSIGLEFVGWLRADSRRPGDRPRQHLVREPAVARRLRHHACGLRHGMVRLGQDDVRVTGGAHLGAHPLVRVSERRPGRLRRPGWRLRRPSFISTTPDRCRQERCCDHGASESEHAAILAEVPPKRKGPPTPCGAGGPCCSGGTGWLASCQIRRSTSRKARWFVPSDIPRCSDRASPNPATGSSRSCWRSSR